MIVIPPLHFLCTGNLHQRRCQDDHIKPRLPPSSVLKSLRYLNYLRSSVVNKNTYYPLAWVNIWLSYYLGENNESETFDNAVKYVYARFRHLSFYNPDFVGRLPAAIKLAEYTYLWVWLPGLFLHASRHSIICFVMQDLVQYSAHPCRQPAKDISNLRFFSKYFCLCRSRTIRKICTLGSPISEMATLSLLFIPPLYFATCLSPTPP